MEMRTQFFFHAIATIRHNKNSIMMLKDSDGQEHFAHDEKAIIIWEAFKDRMGTSEFTQMHFNLSDFIQPSSSKPIWFYSK